MRSTVVACGVTAHAYRISQHRIGELFDFLRHGGREQQRLPLLRQLRDNLPDVVNEAHVEHAVGFVEHEHLDMVEMDCAALIRSSRRPGVATSTSVPAASERTWRLIGTPPMASAARSRRCRP